MSEEDENSDANIDAEEDKNEGEANQTAVTTQPGSSVPPGLEYLSMLDQLLVKQEISLLEVVLPFESSNKYSIFNSMGQNIYYAAEDSNICLRQICGPRRPWTVHVCDIQGRPIMHIERNCNLGAFCPNWPCCSDKVRINGDNGTPYGSVQRKCNPCCPGYTILNNENADVLTVTGPCCCVLAVAGLCCRDQKWEVNSLDGRQVGAIAKQHSGLLKEVMTDADNFSVNFPLDLDAMVKATLLGAVFLIDFNFYETPREQK